MAKGIKIDMKKLEGLIEAMSSIPEARVGILGDKNSRSSSGMSNAQIGQYHEFGMGVPKRSWLRVPLMDLFHDQLERSGLDEEVLFQAIEEGSLEELVRKIGILGEDIIRGGFASGGYGKWQKHAVGYENNTGQILVDSAQLRDSISSEVV